MGLENQPARASTDSPIGRPIWGLAALAVLLVVDGLFLKVNAFRTLYFLDCGPHLDVAWRIFKGQKPCVDFITFAPLLHHYLLALFFAFFGFTKTAIWANLFTLSAGVILMTYFIARQGSVPRALAILAAALAMTSFNWPFSHPWYNQSSHFWGIAAVAVWSCGYSTKSRLGRPASSMAAFFCGGLLAFSLMTKPNTGGCYLLTFLVVFAVSSGRRRELPSYLAGALLGLLCIWILFIPAGDVFLKQVLLYCKNQSGRLTGVLSAPVLFLRNYYWIAGLAVLLRIPVIGRRHVELLVLFFGLWAVAIVATFTSTITFETDVELLGVYAALGFWILGLKPDKPASPSREPQFRRLLLGALAAWSVVLSLLYACYAWQLKAWAFPDFVNTFAGDNIDPVGDYTLQEGPFRG
ncbi:MAG: hypothetical protein WCG06_04305, partial [Candidatus Omnitrophota bacterium]